MGDRGRPVSSTAHRNLSGWVSRPASGVGPERGSSVSVGPFLRPALPTGYLTFPITGSVRGGRGRLSRHSPMQRAGICAGGRPRGRPLPRSASAALAESKPSARPNTSFRSNVAPRRIPEFTHIYAGGLVSFTAMAIEKRFCHSMFKVDVVSEGTRRPVAWGLDYAAAVWRIIRSRQMVLAVRSLIFAHRGHGYCDSGGTTRLSSYSIQVTRSNRAIVSRYEAERTRQMTEGSLLDDPGTKATGFVGARHPSLDTRPHTGGNGEASLTIWTSCGRRSTRGPTTDLLPSSPCPIRARSCP